MNYRVRIGALVHVLLSALPRALRVQVITRLVHDLRERPDALGDVIVPLSARAYSFTLTAEGPIPYRLNFLFAVEVHADAQEYRVIGGRLTQEETGEN